MQAHRELTYGLAYDTTLLNTDMVRNNSPGLWLNIDAADRACETNLVNLSLVYALGGSHAKQNGVVFGRG